MVATIVVPPPPPRGTGGGAACGGCDLGNGIRPLLCRSVPPNNPVVPDVPSVSPPADGGRSMTPPPDVDDEAFASRGGGGGGTTYSTYELRITGVRSEDGTRR